MQANANTDLFNSYILKFLHADNIDVTVITIPRLFSWKTRQAKYNNRAIQYKNILLIQFGVINWLLLSFYIYYNYIGFQVPVLPNDYLYNFRQKRTVKPILQAIAQKDQLHV